jgi:hypothetical protein
MRRSALIMLAVALGLAGCEGGGAYYGGYGYYDDPFYDPWDYGFRYGVYDTHEDIDVDIDRPDRERPPEFERPDRPRPPTGSRIGRAGHQAASTVPRGRWAAAEVASVGAAEASAAAVAGYGEAGGGFHSRGERR